MKGWAPIFIGVGILFIVLAAASDEKAGTLGLGVIGALCIAAGVWSGASEKK